jgi:hypothetical protein
LAPEQATWRRGVLVNLLLAGASTIAVLGLLEVGLRLLDVDVASYHPIGGFTTYDPELGWTLAPSRETVFRGAHFAVKVSHNAEGLRDRHYAYERAPGRRRILVLGDSAVWCWGVEQNECFTELLESALDATDVINTGVPAWSTAQETLFYEREGRRYHADLVLLLVVPNDFWENVSGPGPRFTLDGGRLVETHVPVPRRKPPAAEWLQEHSRLFAEANYLVTVLTRTIGSGAVSGKALLARAFHRAAAPASPPEQSFVAAAPATERSYAVTEALLDRLASDVEHDGARLGLVLEAMPKPMTERLQRFCVERGIAYVDLGPPLREAERGGLRTRLQGDPHIGPAGQQVVATTVRGFVERDGLLRDAAAR